MIIRVQTLIALCVVSGLMVAASAVASESTAFWPQFRGPDRSGVSTSTSLLKKWPDQGPKLVWATEGAGRGYSSLSMAKGRLFTMGDSVASASNKDEYLLCYGVEDGNLIWKTRLGAAWNQGPQDWQSSRSTPTIDGDMVYALTAHGDLVCARVSDGEEVWRKNLRDDFAGKKGDGWGYSESVLIDGDHLVCTPGGSENTMVALNKMNGKLVWASSRADDRGAGHASIISSQVGNTKVYVQTTASGALGVRASDGKLLWSYPIDKTTAVIPTPIVRGHLVFFTAGYNRGGALLQQVPVSEEAVDVKEIYPLNRKLQNKHGNVVLVGNHLYGDSGDSGMPFCADLMTGEILWKERGSGKGSASLVAADGYLYIHYSNSVMALAKATPDGFTEISSFTIPGGSGRPTWAHPVIADGKLFVREDGNIHCYELQAGSR